MASAPAARFAPGDRVMSRYMAQKYGAATTMFYAAEIVAVTRCDAAKAWVYDVEYADGDTEDRVPEKFLRVQTAKQAAAAAEAKASAADAAAEPAASDAAASTSSGGGGRLPPHGLSDAQIAELLDAIANARARKVNSQESVHGWLVEYKLRPQPASTAGDVKVIDPRDGERLFSGAQVRRKLGVSEEVGAVGKAGGKSGKAGGGGKSADAAAAVAAAEDGAKDDVEDEEEEEEGAEDESVEEVSSGSSDSGGTTSAAPAEAAAAKAATHPAAPALVASAQASPARPAAHSGGDGGSSGGDGGEAKQEGGGGEQTDEARLVAALAELRRNSVDAEVSVCGWTLRYKLRGASLLSANGHRQGDWTAIAPGGERLFSFVKLSAWFKRQRGAGSTAQSDDEEGDAAMVVGRGRNGGAGAGAGAGGRAVRGRGVDDAVEALHNAQRFGTVHCTEWYAGRVLVVRPDGSMDIKYNDGEVEKHVPPRYVRELSRRPRAAAPQAAAAPAAQGGRKRGRGELEDDDESGGDGGGRNLLAPRLRSGTPLEGGCPHCGSRKGGGRESRDTRSRPGSPTPKSKDKEAVVAPFVTASVLPPPAPAPQCRCAAAMQWWRGRWWCAYEEGGCGMELTPPPDPLTPLCNCATPQPALWMHGVWWCARAALAADASQGCGLQVDAPARGRASPTLILAAEERSPPQPELCADAPVAKEEEQEESVLMLSVDDLETAPPLPPLDEPPPALEQSSGVAGLAEVSAVEQEGEEEDEVMILQGAGRCTPVAEPSPEESALAAAAAAPRRSGRQADPVPLAPRQAPSAAYLPAPQRKPSDGSAPLPRHHRHLKRCTQMEVEAGASTASMLTAGAYGPMNAACFVAADWRATPPSRSTAALPALPIAAVAPCAAPASSVADSSSSVAALPVNHAATCTAALPMNYVVLGDATDAFAISRSATPAAPMTPPPPDSFMPVPSRVESGGSEASTRGSSARGDGDGLGLFARDFIFAGDAIGEWGGPLRGNDELRSPYGACLIPGTRLFVDGALLHAPTGQVRLPATYARPVASGFNATIVCRFSEDATAAAAAPLSPFAVAAAATALGDPGTAAAARAEPTELRMWLVAEDKIEAGGEIRYDAASANLPPAMLAALLSGEDDSKEAVWQARRVPPGFAPPNLGPDPIEKLDRICFPEKAEGDKGEGGMEFREEHDYMETHGEANGEEPVKAEPPPLYG